MTGKNTTFTFNTKILDYKNRLIVKAAGDIHLPRLPPKTCNRRYLSFTLSKDRYTSHDISYILPSP